MVYWRKPWLHLRREVNTLAQKVTKAGIKRQKGYLYYLDKQGDVSMAKMARGGKKGGYI